MSPLRNPIHHPSLNPFSSHPSVPTPTLLDTPLNTPPEDKLTKYPAYKHKPQPPIPNSRRTPSTKRSPTLPSCISRPAESPTASRREDRSGLRARRRTMRAMGWWRGGGGCRLMGRGWRRRRRRQWCWGCGSGGGDRSRVWRAAVVGAALVERV